MAVLRYLAAKAVNEIHKNQIGMRILNIKDGNLTLEIRLKHHFAALAQTSVIFCNYFPLHF